MQLTNDEGRSMGCTCIQPRALNALSEERFEILRLLAEKPRYPAELSRELGAPVQTIYYHIRMLEKAKLLDFVEYEEHNGGIAKKYTCSSESFALILNNRSWKVRASPKKIVPYLFSHFVCNGFFDGVFIIGSPDPHGKYRARASELGVLELAMLLGQYASFSFPLYMLDTQTKAEDKKRNLIVAGGPKVNVITEEINATLPIRFRGNFELYSTLSKKKYIENTGVIELIQNPFYKKSKILFVGGLNYTGTRAAMLALVKNMNELSAGNSINQQVLARVVEGFDEDGDGQIDAVDILE